MRNKGFVLMETIVVIVVISVALLTIFSSYNKILIKVKSENKYDTSEYIYMTKHIREYLKKDGCNLEVNNIYLENDLINFKVTDYYNGDKCSVKTNNEYVDGEETKLKFPIKRIYVLTNINKFDNLIDKNNNDTKDDGEIKNSEYFDAYMIDYIKKLDVTDTDKLIMVEYQREVLDVNAEHVIDSNGKPLYETYIASLEW